MIRIGLSGFFSQRPSSVQHRFPHPDITLCDDSSDDSNYDPADPFFPESLPDLLPRNASPYVCLRISQDAIGWDHFLRGKLSKQWTALQYKYASRHGFLQESRHWTTWLIHYLAHRSFSIWDTPNKSRHGHDHATTTQAKTIQVHRDITVMYHLRDSVLPADRDLFCSSLDTHLARPLSTLKGRLAINKDLILWSVRTAKLQSKSGTRPLSNYFSSLSRPKRTIRPKHKHTPKAPRPSIPTRLTRFFRPID
jgi:hypothetical protein